MRGFRSRIVFAAFSLACMAPVAIPTAAVGSPAAEEPKVEGTWRWSWTDANGTEHKRALKVHREGGKLSGIVVGEGGKETAVSDIRLEGSSLLLRFEAERNGEKVEFRYEGKIDGDSIQGTVHIGSSSYPWTPRREGAPDSKDDTWIQLIKGYSPAESGWKLRRAPDDKSKNGWTLKDGILANTVPEGGHGIDLYHERKLDDFELHVEFKIPKGSNSGVYLRGCYEVQVDDAHGRKELTRNMCGAIYNEREPLTNACLPPGEWQTFDITLAGNKVTVLHNGKKVIEEFELMRKTGGALDKLDGVPLEHGDAGPILLQGDHGNVEYRNIRVRPIPTKL